MAQSLNININLRQTGIDIFDDILGKIQEVGKAMAETDFEALTGLSEIGEKIADSFSSIENAIETVGDTIKDIVNSVINKSVENVADGSQRALKSLEDATQKMAARTVLVVSTLSVSLWSVLRGTFSKTSIEISTISGLISALDKKLLTPFLDVFNHKLLNLFKISDRINFLLMNMTGEFSKILAYFGNIFHFLGAMSAKMFLLGSLFFSVKEGFIFFRRLIGGGNKLVSPLERIVNLITLADKATGRLYNTWISWLKVGVFGVVTKFIPLLGVFPLLNTLTDIFLVNVTKTRDKLGKMLGSSRSSFILIIQSVRELLGLAGPGIASFVENFAKVSKATNKANKEIKKLGEASSQLKSIANMKFPFAVQFQIFVVEVKKILLTIFEQINKITLTIQHVFQVSENKIANIHTKATFLTENLKNNIEKNSQEITNYIDKSFTNVFNKIYSFSKNLFFGFLKEIVGAGIFLIKNIGFGVIREIFSITQVLLQETFILAKNIFQDIFSVGTNFIKGFWSFITAGFSIFWNSIKKITSFVGGIFKPRSKEKKDPIVETQKKRAEEDRKFAERAKVLREQYRKSVEEGKILTKKEIASKKEKIVVAKEAIVVSEKEVQAQILYMKAMKQVESFQKIKKVAGGGIINLQAIDDFVKKIKKIEEKVITGTALVKREFLSLLPIFDETKFKIEALSTSITKSLKKMMIQISEFKNMSLSLNESFKPLLLTGEGLKNLFVSFSKNLVFFILSFKTFGKQSDVLNKLLKKQIVSLVNLAIASEKGYLPFQKLEKALRNFINTALKITALQTYRKELISLTVTFDVFRRYLNKLIKGRIFLDPNQLIQPLKVLKKELDKLSKSGLKGKTYGEKISALIAEGLTKNKGKVEDATIALAKLIEAYFPSSPAKKGPLTKLPFFGAKIVDYIIKGMLSRLSAIMKAAFMIALIIAKFFPRSLPLMGPLVGIVRSGALIPYYIAKGIMQGIGSVTKAVSNVASTILGTLQKTANLGFLAERIGVGVEKISALENVLVDVGATSSDLSFVFTRMRNTLTKAFSTEEAEKVKNLGINLSDIKKSGDPLINLFLQVSRIMKKVPINSKKAKDALELIGVTTHSKLINVLLKGEDEIQNLMKQGVKLGTTYDTTFVKISQKITGMLNRLKRVTDFLIVDLAKQVAPMLEKTISQAMGLIEKYRGDIQAFIIIIVQSIKQVFEVLKTLIVFAVTSPKEMFAFLMNAIMAFYNFIKDIGTSIYNFLLDKAKDFIPVIESFLQSSIIKIFKNLAMLIINKIIEVGEVGEDVLNYIWETTTIITTITYKYIKKVIEYLINIVKRKVLTIFTFMTKEANKLLLKYDEVVEDLEKNIEKVVIWIIGKLGKIITIIFTTMKNIVLGVLGIVWYLLKKIWDSITKGILGELLGRLLQAIGILITSLWGALKRQITYRINQLFLFIIQQVNAGINKFSILKKALTKLGFAGSIKDLENLEKKLSKSVVEISKRYEDLEEKARKNKKKIEDEGKIKTEVKMKIDSDVSEVLKKNKEAIKEINKENKENKEKINKENKENKEKIKEDISDIKDKNKEAAVEITKTTVKILEGSEKAFDKVKNSFNTLVNGLKKGATSIPAALEEEIKKLDTILSKTNLDKIKAKLEKEKNEQINNINAITKKQADSNSNKEENEKEIEAFLTNVRKRITDAELSELDKRHFEELKKIDEKHAEELLKFSKLADYKNRENELKTIQGLEKEKLLEKQHRQDLRNTFNVIGQGAASLENLFTTVYEESGKKLKEFFYLSKAAAIAQATMNIAVAITNALGGGFMAIAQAAIISAMGGIQIGKIAAQTFATGGPVIGGSGKKDDVPALLTSGEFVLPVKSVQYYGAEFMEAIRQKMLPRDLLSNITANLPSPIYKPKTGRFAAGGLVSNVSPVSEKPLNPPLNIVNLIDPNLMDKYLAGSSGQNTIINVLRANKYELKRIIEE